MCGEDSQPEAQMQQRELGQWSAAQLEGGSVRPHEKRTSVR